MREVCCSFCGRSKDEVEYIVAKSIDTVGPEVNICDECMDISVEIIGESAAKKGFVVHQIRRSIVFPPEYKQAGASILSYFAEVLEEKYPGEKSRVKIVQNGLEVSLIVETSEGDVETITKELNNFSAVIAGRMAPEDYMTNKLAAMQLRNKLELAAMEVKMTRNLLDFSRSEHQSRISSLESQVAGLHTLLASSLNLNSSLHESVRDVFLMSEHYASIKPQVEKIVARLRAGITEADEAEVKAELEKVAKQDRGILRSISTMAQQSAAGASGSLLAVWILQILSGG